jgi:SAM-dependent methyltransferase
MKDLTPNYNYNRLIEEEKEHYSNIEVTDDLMEGGWHASSPWKYYWTRVAEELRFSPFSDMARYLESQCARPDRPVRILSLGSGYCGNELAMARNLKCAYEIMCTDINEDLFTEARKRAQADGLSIRFQVEDLNFIQIAPGYYDMIFAHAVLHHVINLEMLFDQIAGGLTSGGILHLVEVIGKNRRLLWEENEHFANLILVALPNDLTGDDKLHAPSEGEGMEGVRQEEILPILRQRFEPIYEYAHGAFMRFVCTDERLGRHFNPEHEIDRRYLDLLIDIDRSAVRNGILRPLEIWGVYRLRSETVGASGALSTTNTVRLQRAIADVVDQIADLPDDWHGAGTVSPRVLRAIAFHVERIGKIRHSMETGSGKTTLLFSHLSANHLVFAVDDGDSISQVRKSPLFNPQNVTFIEGPTQRTLPRHNFAHKVQIALIDGPHGFPFPDIEYYYFYPIIETGGLLLIDDIQIPSIGRMFEIIKADDMFDLLEIVDNMAFFGRTKALCTNPESDSWWLQGYNRKHYEKHCEQMLRSHETPLPHVQVLRSDEASSTHHHPRLRAVLHVFNRVIPMPVKNLIPMRLKRRLKRAL